jgi:hypothetical protein
VLNFGSSDFAVNARADLKYAQAYTLVHFGLESDKGALRDRFLDFMRSARRGQSSQTHFADAMKMDDAKIERAWQAHVKTFAGR